MDAKTCLQKLQKVGVLAFATADEDGNPQIRNISAIHYEPEAMYFFTAKGKNFCRELLSLTVPSRARRRGAAGILDGYDI